DLTGCGGRELPAQTGTPDFYMQGDGVVDTRRVSSNPLSRGTFPAGRGEKFKARLPQEAPRRPQFPVLHSWAPKRYKRRWSPPPFKIIENDNPPFPKEIDMIASDSSVNHSVYYTLSGPGVTQAPLGLFTLDTNTGMLSVHRAVDREEFSHFELLVKVFDRVTHEETDQSLTVTVDVEDVNDNLPTFSGPLLFSVEEHSRPGTVVGKVNATDRDDPQTLHAKISYSLLPGSDIFLIDRVTGVITTGTAVLDREVKDTHLVIVQIRDMDGGWNGLSSTATATVKVQDINDNPPTFARASFSVSVEENQVDGLILRIPVEDRDQVGTGSWRAVFVITRGDENGNFKIETDAKTNEGLLFVTKALDYEKTKKVSLLVQAQNKLGLVGTTSSWLSVPVDVEVLDIDEGPEFSAQNLHLTIKENTAIGTVIGTYTATDPETKSSKSIRYHKLSDAALWFDLSESTGELRTAGAVDRESLFVEHNLYNITVRAVDASSKMATGTVIIHIEDVNDNAPNIPQMNLLLCSTDAELGSVVVMAEDSDDFPFAQPFTFNLADHRDNKWTITSLNDTAALLQEARNLPVGRYAVPLLVRDQQGLGKEQAVTVRVCHCVHGNCAPAQHSAALGLWGLLVPLMCVALLLFCKSFFFILACVTKPEKVFIDDNHDSAGMLLKSNTEGPGEKVDAGILLSPPSLEQSAKGSVSDGRAQRMSKLTAKVEQDAWQQTDGLAVTGSLDGWTVAHHGSGQQPVNQGCFKYAHLSSYSLWEINGLYINKKLNEFLEKGEGRYADDILHLYGFEGQGSPAGSTGCCSDFGDDRSLDFLDALGPKFKALAELCTTK
ncbi:desmocollin-3-like, partial [Arapaima gigas]